MRGRKPNKIPPNCKEAKAKNLRKQPNLNSTLRLAYKSHIRRLTATKSSQPLGLLKRKSLISIDFKRSESDSDGEIRLSDLTPTKPGTQTPPTPRLNFTPPPTTTHNVPQSQKSDNSESAGHTTEWHHKLRHWNSSHLNSAFATRLTVDEDEGGVLHELKLAASSGSSGGGRPRFSHFQTLTVDGNVVLASTAIGDNGHSAGTKFFDCRLVTQCPATSLLRQRDTFMHVNPLRNNDDITDLLRRRPGWEEKAFGLWGTSLRWRDLISLGCYRMELIHIISVMQAHVIFRDLLPILSGTSEPTLVVYRLNIGFNPGIKKEGPRLCMWLHDPHQLTPLSMEHNIEIVLSTDGEWLVPTVARPGVFEPKEVHVDAVRKAYRAFVNGPKSRNMMWSINECQWIHLD
jgi:hypothetical protein